MSEEDTTNLSQNLHKLEIVPKNINTNYYDDKSKKCMLKFNPFAKKSRFKSVSTASIFGPSCVCRKNRVCKNKKLTNINKNKVLRDPVIVLHEKCKHELSQTAKSKLSKIKSDSELSTKKFGHDNTHQDFRSIIDGCEQLSLSSDVPNFSNQNFRDSDSGNSSGSSNSNSRNDNRELSSCSQQAMARLCINPPCDVTIDELASYFETFVHIPKKMSSMAEMMYI